MSLISKTDEGARIAAVVEPSLAASGYELVRVLLRPGNRPTLQVMIERHDGLGIMLDECAAVSRSISAVLDVEDPIAGTYNLEVSSPGIDRPLTRAKDFARFAGHEAKIELSAPQAGRRRFRGRLLGLEGENVRLAAADEEWTLPLQAIDKAQLVMTDALLAEAMQQRRNQVAR